MRKKIGQTYQYRLQQSQIKKKKKKEKAGCYGCIIKLFIRFLKNKLCKITLDFSTDHDYSKLQYSSLEDALLSVGLKERWEKMQEFSSNAVSFFIFSDRIRNIFLPCMQLQDAPFIPFRWACLTMLCSRLNGGFQISFQEQLQQ